MSEIQITNKDGKVKHLIIHKIGGMHAFGLSIDVDNLMEWM